MKTSLIIVSIALFAVFTIPEITCSENRCADFGDRCLANSDCCSDNCRFTGNPHTSFCLESKNITQHPRIEKGFCFYNSSLNKNESNNAFVMYGINAAHSLLLPYTQVELSYGNKTIDVTINGFEKKSNETLLEISREAALQLGIEKNGEFPCSIKVNVPEPNYSSLKKIIGITSSFFVVVLVIMYIL
ncbi:uncharacterized protein LOC112596336 [Melanaphis sacchari]|uniref:uncharacterized protein LOC112596336 n=1 Tax=Melanaphis sacchari TaxID=742174 RepID=UPI000DC14415|nr:uncharacterized protein LOC112596336 [Melanaphis sacchari]